VFQPGFVIKHADFDPLDPPPFILFFHLPIGSALGPAQERTTGAAWAAMAGNRIPTAKGVEDGRLIALVGLGEDRRQMSRPETVPGIFAKGTGQVASWRPP
jgi:hypothetical protein